MKMQTAAAEKLGVCDVGIPDEPPPEGAGEEVEPDAGPQWLRVLLWKQSSPPAQVWVTCRAEGQPAGALWVGEGREPGPGDPGISVKADQSVMTLFGLGRVATSLGQFPAFGLRGMLSTVAQIATSRRDLLMRLKSALTREDGDEALALAKCLVGLGQE